MTLRARKNNPKKCKGCGAYKGHHPLCSYISAEEAKRDLRRYYSLWLILELKIRAIEKVLRKGWEDK